MSSRPVVVTGAAGMLGSALLATAPAHSRVIGVDIQDGDVSKTHGARQAIAPHDPCVVIHCAAMTDVDGCTRDPAAAYRVNARGTANVALVCHEVDCYLIVLSTDYVFDGQKTEPYTEEDAPAPLNAYGESKLQGELFAQESHDRLLIVRTQWLYGPNGRNFVDTIVRKGREMGSVRVVADEFGSPTYTRDLAVRLWELVARQPTGIVHCANQGVCSWADLARVALRAAGVHADVQDISRQDWDSPTRRPQYTPLVSTRLGELGLAPLRSWQEAAVEYVSAYLA